MKYILIFHVLFNVHGLMYLQCLPFLFSFLDEAGAFKTKVNISREEHLGCTQVTYMFSLLFQLLFWSSSVTYIDKCMYDIYMYVDKCIYGI